MKVHKQFCPSTGKSAKVVVVKTLVTFVAFTMYKQCGRLSNTTPGSNAAGAATSEE